MDETNPSSDQPTTSGAATLEPPREPAPTYPPPMVYPAPSAWNMPRDPMRRLWTAALAFALLVAVGGLGFLYIDDTSNQNAVRALRGETQNLKSDNQNLKTQVATTQANLTATLGELATTRAQLEHPHLVIWNVPQRLQGPSWYLAGGVPDTFTYHLVASSNGPMSVSILTLEQWAKAIECVDNGVANTHYCMHHSGAFRSWLGVTSVNYDFHGAEGCADYVAVFTAATPVLVTPNVSVTYNPASSSTGSCA